MSDAKNFPDEGQNLLGSVMGPMWGAIAELRELTAYDLPEHENKPFVEFTHWINTRPRFIADWRSDSETEQWDYPRFMIVADGVRAAYAAVRYHFGRLKQLEDAAREIMAKHDLSKHIPPNSAVGFGSMHKLDFEYHAYVLAYRRSLDYLAWGLSTYFKQKQSSFQRFGRLLAGAHPSDVAAAVKAVYDRHSPSFAFVMDEERGRSVRDRLTHREFVPAGNFNVTPYGFSLFGGGEKLGLGPHNGRSPFEARPLADVLEERRAALHACLADFLETFRTAVIEHERNI
jgi:hypothetical protein